MIFMMASTSAYDSDEVQLSIRAEAGECIRVGDIISIPMNDHTFEEREITDMYRDWNKWRKGKGLFSEIKEGEWAECIIHNIHSGQIHTISSPYDDEIFEGEPFICQVSDPYEFLRYQVKEYNWDNGFDLPTSVLEDSSCDLALALEIFYLGDGYGYLQGDDSQNQDWLNFIRALKEAIENGKYQRSENNYKIPLTRVQRYKLKKTGVAEVFLEDI